jgi:hypothetical protein
MAEKKPSLSEAIRAAVPPVPGRCQPWWKRLTPSDLAEIEVIRSDWRSGKMPGSKRAVAMAIASELKARGLSDIGVPGVLSWLAKD